MLFCQPAFAHKLKVFATAEGADISGYVYFPGGGRAADLDVQVLGADDAVLGETRTNNDGEFTFTATSRQDHTFKVEPGDGHAATHTVSAGELPLDLAPPGGVTEAPEALTPGEPAVEAPQTGPPTGEATVFPSSISGDELRDLIEKAVSRQVNPLREQLEAYEERIALRDLLGGIGYILGIMGIVFLLKSRSKPE